MPRRRDCGSRILTGRDRAAERARTLAALAAGEIDILVGTHALVQEGVAFRDLAFVIVDEQHRFGVHQRLALGEKGEAVDVLVMTATPIPRTLVLTYFGDMDVSTLREKPAGRAAHRYARAAARPARRGGRRDRTRDRRRCPRLLDLPARRGERGARCGSRRAARRKPARTCSAAASACCTAA